MNGYVPSPKPHPRVKPEAAEYAQRNRGGMEKWFSYDDNVKDYNSPRPGDRLRTDEAKKIAETNKGCMSQLMGGYPDPPVKRELHPRGVPSTAAEIAESNKGQGMKNLIVNYGNLGISDRPHPKVKGHDAEEYAEREHGVVDHIMNNYGKFPPSPQPVQKVSYGGEDVANKHKGADMGPLMRMEQGRQTPTECKYGRLHMESDGAGWDEEPPHIRVRPEAEEIMSKYSRSEMKDILKGSPTNGEQKHKAKIIKHMTESEDPRPRTSPARTRPEAMQYYQRNHDSEMGAILGGKPLTNSANYNKNNRLLKRSEDW